ncbi:ABC transporter permease, partial [Pseudarthrobacter sp. NPDC089323]
MILGITLLVFLVLQAAPGDQASSALGEGASEEAKEQYRQANGLNDPILLQYVRFLGKLLQFDLGVTTPPAKSVASMIGSAFPLTLQLTFLGVIIAVVVSLVFGITGALYRDKWQDQLVRVFSIAAVATPSFWLGILLIQWFALGPAPMFPSGGIAT